MADTTLSREEMGVGKFKMYIDDTCEKLGGIDLTSDSINPLTFIWGNKVDNPYTQAIINRSFKDKRRPADFANAYKNLTGFIRKEREAMEIADRLYLKSMESNARYHFLFWALLILVVDGKENRADNAAVIADAAYLLGFDKDAVDDWLLAVKTSLNEQSWQHIKFKTKLAQNFFQKLNL